MPYLGNSPEVQNYTLTIDKFNGDGACTVFTLSRPIDDAVAVEVLVNNVQQTPFDSYTVSGGVITFSAAPSIGSNNIVAITRATTIFTKTQVGTADIQDGAITSSKIANGTVIAADIADGSVTGPKLGQTAINANNIVDGAITGPKIGLTAINANNIVDGAVTGNKIGLTSINANNIVDGAITGDKIGLTAINANNIVDGAITGDKIGLTAINANNIVNGGVTVAKGGTGLSTLTANSVVLGNGTDPVQLIAPGTSGNVLTSNGTNWTSQAAAAGGGDYNLSVYTSSATWTKPAGLKAVKVTVIGAGGNGGNSFTGCGLFVGGGGGGGGGALKYIDAPTIPGPVAVTVGTAPSKTSSFGAFVSATGGTDGGNGSPTSPGTSGAGGSGSGGDVNLLGGRGAPFAYGGMSALNFGPSTTPTQNIQPTQNGNLYGGGAQGSVVPSPAGGTGAAGIVIVEEFY